MSGRLAREGLLVAVALLLGFVERLLPPLMATVPGVKLGLANLATLLALTLLGPWAGLRVAVARILLGAFLFAGASGLPFSLAGGLLAWAVMALAWRWLGLGLPGISLCGGVAHNLGQIALAALLYCNAALWAYLPALTLVGSVSGFALGLLARILHARLERILRGT